MIADVGLAQRHIVSTDMIIRIGFGRIKTLHELQDNLAISRAHCSGNLNTLESILKSPIFAETPARSNLEREMFRYEEYIRSTNALYDRLRGLTDLVSLYACLSYQETDTVKGRLQSKYRQSA